MKKFLLCIVIIALMCTCIYSLSKVFDTVSTHANAQEEYDEIDNLIMEANTKSKQIKPHVEKQSSNKEIENALLHLNMPTVQNFSKDAWNKLYAINNDFTGYLEFDSGLIREPICQAKDNNFYLRRNIYKEWNDLGTVFMNYQNKWSDQNVAIYGHDSSYDHTVKFAPINDIMSGNLSFENNKHFSIYLKNEVRRYEICYIYVNSDMVNYNHQFTNQTKEEFDKFFSYVRANNKIQNDQDIQYGDHFVILQTCLRVNNYYKVLAVAKEIGSYPYEF